MYILKERDRVEEYNTLGSISLHYVVKPKGTDYHARSLEAKWGDIKVAMDKFNG